MEEKGYLVWEELGAVTRAVTVPDWSREIPTDSRPCALWWTKKFGSEDFASGVTLTIK